MREGAGKIETTSDPKVTYIGEFSRDKRCGQVTEFSAGAQKEIMFKGQLDEQEDAEGECDLMSDKVHYRGGFLQNRVHGKGNLHHSDTGNFYEGQF